MTDHSRAALRAILDSRWSDLDEQLKAALPADLFDDFSNTMWTMVCAERAMADEAIPREVMTEAEFAVLLPREPG